MSKIERKTGVTATMTPKARARDPRWDGLARHGREDRPFWEAVNRELLARATVLAAVPDADPVDEQLAALKADRTAVKAVVDLVQGFEDMVMALPTDFRALPTGVTTVGSAKLERKVTFVNADAHANTTLLAAVAANDLKISLPMSDIRASVPAAGVSAAGNTTFILILEQDTGTF